MTLACFAKTMRVQGRQLHLPGLCGIRTSIVSCIDTHTGLIQRLQLSEIEVVDIISGGIQAGGIIEKLSILWGEFPFISRIQKLPFFMA